MKVLNGFVGLKWIIIGAIFLALAIHPFGLHHYIFDLVIVTWELLKLAWNVILNLTGPTETSPLATLWDSFIRELPPRLYTTAKPPYNFVVLLSVIIMSAFCFVWGDAVRRCREWGAFGVGLVRLNFTIYMIGLIFISRRKIVEDIRTIDNPNILPLMATIVFIAIVWLLGITYFLLFDDHRRALYAQAYFEKPKPEEDICPEDGRIKQNGRCPECDKIEVKTRLEVGNEAIPLIFTEEKWAYILGREQKQISKQAEHPNRISREHIKVRYHPSRKRFTVQDLRSTNLTYLNDNALEANQYQWLNHGDRINLAKEVELVFYADDDSGAG